MTLRDALDGAGTPGAARMWGAYAGTGARPLPPKGLDAIWARARGAAARRRASRSDRARAERIIAGARGLETLSERDLDARARSAGEEVLLHRARGAALDHAASHVVEVIRREVGLRLHPEQIMGGLAMCAGRCVEMATGEGKTVTAILPAAVFGWMRRGVHIHTVNDYLARRDAEVTGRALARLGLSVGVLQDDTKPADRREAYARDVTYGADKQFIFDFLRDRLLSPIDPTPARITLDEIAPVEGRSGRWTAQVVQRGLFAAIVDEADSVLIDEAVTPAIIGLDAGGTSEAQRFHRTAAEFARAMRPGVHYTVDARLRRVMLTEAGRSLLRERAEELPAFWRGPRRREELANLALQAKELYRREDEYIVRDGSICIVDGSTGRVLEGRQWQLGVHQAVEAKEGLELSAERITSARVSYQRFFQRYARLCGMSGTVWEVAGELWRDYALPVTRIPTHRPVVRRLALDRVFLDQPARDLAVSRRVAELHAQGRPVLVGTRSVEASERLGAMLAERAVPCRVLNATREAEEAAIVAEAGQPGAVTVATNMAGRGTDILLTPRTRELGGLVVLATERNDERRVDRQLFGRSGRQGDPGLAETYVSLDDRLLVQSGSRALRRLAKALPPGPRTAVARVLLRQAQWAASRVLAVRRAESAKQDAWIELALHGQTR
ncbi:MAG: hypothetical protein IT439_10810 [Phycisphaerales bacterium]|nr:hypothetical protein [Phycisphaerales bacterium]